MIHAVYIIIGLIGLWLLKTIAVNQHLLAKNQVSQAKQIQEIIEKLDK